MADFGRISSSYAEAAVTLPSGDDAGRVTSTYAEAAVTLPSGDARARASSTYAEALVTLPSGDTLSRVSSLYAEAATTEVGPEARLSYVAVEVFSQAPAGLRKRSGLSGVQGQGVNTFSR